MEKEAETNSPSLCIRLSGWTLSAINCVLTLRSIIAATSLGLYIFTNMCIGAILPAILLNIRPVRRETKDEAHESSVQYLYIVFPSDVVLIQSKRLNSNKLGIIIHTSQNNGLVDLVGYLNM